MSVWTSAVIEHPWNEFSEQIIRQISQAATGSQEFPRWFGCPDVKSAEEAFKAHGDVAFFLPEDFSLCFYSNILELQQAIRWSSFLTVSQKRHDFLRACKLVAQLCSAKELIFLPEGVADLFIDSKTTFEEFKVALARELGPPDLDISRLYTEQEVSEMPQDRVHYCHALIAKNMSELPHA